MTRWVDGPPSKRIEEEDNEKAVRYLRKKNIFTASFEAAAHWNMGRNTLNETYKQTLTGKPSWWQNFTWEFGEPLDNQAEAVKRNYENFKNSA